MRAMIGIMVNTLRETLRDRVLYSILFFAAVMLLVSNLMGEFSVFQKEQVVQDFVLGMVSFFGLAMALFVGIGLIQKEITRKTIFNIFSKPIPRWQFFLGKYLGLLVVLLICLILLVLGVFLVLWLNDVKPSPFLYQAYIGLYFEMVLVVAAGFLFASFSTPFLSAFFTIGVYIIGHLTGNIIQHLDAIKKHGVALPGAVEVPEYLEKIVRVMYWLVPNLESLNLKGVVVYHQGVTAEYLVLAVAYTLCYSSIYVMIACWWLNRRDFN